MLIRLDVSSAVPIFEQVAASIRTDMAAGQLNPGDKLPSARDVSASLGVNLHTVLRAYQALRDEGLVDMRRGRGAVVTPAAGALTDLIADIRHLGAKASVLGIAPDALAALVRDIVASGPE